MKEHESGFLLRLTLSTMLIDCYDTYLTLFRRIFKVSQNFPSFQKFSHFWRESSRFLDVLDGDEVM